MQINLAISDAAAPDGLLRIFEDVFALVDELTDERDLEGFHFVRKSPGLRLRFLLREEGGGAARSLEDCAAKLVGDQLAERWFVSVYEAETFKFGGPSAMSAVHDYFSADCQAWWRWERQRSTTPSRISARLLSVSVLNDLFAGFLEGPEEVWDVWCRVASLHGATITVGQPPAAAPMIDDLTGSANVSELAALRVYSDANAALAARFTELRESGTLLFADRLVLPHLALYHWNRFGFTLASRSDMFTAMFGAWSPHAEPAIQGG
jgi:thiopeptide-type bacteriocin biosynthesis protein